MKYCRILLFCFAAVFCMQLTAQETTPNPLLTSGRVDGAVYRNSHFGFNYFIPEGWTSRGTPGKLPGNPDSYLLLTLKKKLGDPISSVMLSTAELSGKYNGDLQQYLDVRYRLREGSTESDTTINGIPTSRSKRAGRDPQLIVIGDRNFYRIDTQSTGVTRVAVATTVKGCALVFELIVPTRYADDTTMQFMDSLHSLDFSAGAKAEKK